MASGKKNKSVSRAKSPGTGKRQRREPQRLIAVDDDSDAKEKKALKKKVEKAESPKKGKSVKVSSTEKAKKKSVKAAPSPEKPDEKKLSIKFSGEDEQSNLC
eukprot:CAMPEP_0194350010 /NCGR_PEP_ID=MMETSP0171-20130528/107403_1 /TAXON_ID=218684 /ORGANISM="Corethron pennatum, Strain L29A3" /LENGTH=101 /DNA_ID=CAMNT_0039117517 /DNA_START=57 /DNA_END=362 /DNA_ORIENTATION=-